MSSVTNLLILPSICDDEWVADFNRLIDEESGHGPLTKISEALAPGGKRLESPVYAKAFNYFGPLGIHETVARLQPRSPWDFQYAIKDQHDESWTFFTFADAGRLAAEHA